MHLDKITVISHVSIACEKEKLRVRRENCGGLYLHQFFFSFLSYHIQKITFHHLYRMHLGFFVPT
jgi:hypothetical protein